jgi:hypothetical protein
MSVSPADVKDIAPEFASVLDARVQRFIDRAKLSVNEDIFGRVYDLAVAYLAAHMLAMAVAPSSGGGGIGLIVTQEKVGDLSRSYADTSAVATDAALSRTRFGDEFLRLRRQCVISPAVVTGSGSLDE